MTAGVAPDARRQLEDLRREVRRLEAELRAGRDAELAALPDPLELVLARTCGTAVAIAAAHVVEVLPRVLLSPLPEAPRHVAGLMQYRGSALPVLDLAALWTGDPAAARLDQHIVVVEWGGARRGLLVDGTDALLAVPRAALSAVPADAPGAALSLASLALDDGLVLVVSLEAVAGLAAP